MNKKVLTLAIGSALAFGGAVQMASAQQIVATSDPEATLQGAAQWFAGGVGDKLIGSYYSVGGGNETYISIVNTTDRAKAVKVRFREARGSIDVLDFHLYLSPFDVWVAGLTIRDSAVTGDPYDVAVLFTPDTSCTVPFLGGIALRDAPPPVGPGANDQPRVGVLREAALPLVYRQGDPNRVELRYQRVREGYIEIIEMADFGVVPPGQDQPTDYDQRRGAYNPIDTTRRMNAADFRWATKHVQDVPRDCQAVRLFNNNLITPNLVSNKRVLPISGANLVERNFLGQPANQTNDILVGNPVSMQNENFRAPTGGLFGNVGIINIERGSMIPFAMDAIQSGFASDWGAPGALWGSRNAGLNGNIYFSQNPAPGALGALEQWTADRGLIWSAAFDFQRDFSDPAAGTGISINRTDLPDLSTATNILGLPTQTVRYYYNTASVTSSDNVGTPGLPLAPVTPGYQNFVGLMSVTGLLESINAALNAATLSNEYVSVPSLLAATDWVVTFPTKRFHTAYRYDLTTGVPVPTHRAEAIGGNQQGGLNLGYNGWIEPFVQGFNQRTGESCNPISVKAWNREERTPSGLLDFSPTRGGVPQLCYEVNVISFNNGDLSLPSQVFGAVDTRVNLTVPGSGDLVEWFEAGWAQLGLTPPGQQSCDSQGGCGLPVVGFQGNVLVNTTIGPQGGFYGGSSIHRRN